MKENFVQPLAISFQANQEMQGRKTEREIQHEAILHGYAKSSHGYAKSSHGYAKSSHGYAKSSHAMRNSKGEQLHEKFRALPGVHCIHTIYHFKAREVRSPTL